MGISLKTIMSISDAFRDLFKRDKYEHVVLSIINKSTSLIVNTPLSYNNIQSNKEPDYCDVKGTKCDVKLLLDRKQGALIGDRKNELVKWIESMMDESSEFSEYIVKRGQFDITTTKLYCKLQ